MLEAGEIDLMPNISYSAEREQTLLFPRTPRAPNATTSTPSPIAMIWPRATPKHSRALPSAATLALYQLSSLSSGLPTKASPVTYKEIDTGGASFEALSDGEVDAVIMNDTISSPDASPHVLLHRLRATTILPSPKAAPRFDERHQCRHDGNARVNPRYNDEVGSSYPSTKQRLVIAHRPREASWLKANGNTITLGYLKTNFPTARKMTTARWKGRSPRL